MFQHVDATDVAQYSKSIEVVPRPDLLLFAAHFCLSEIHNGGLLQFFWNSTGIMAPEAIEGFQAIGMLELASVIRAAAAPLGAPYPRDRDDRWDAMLAASGKGEDELASIFKQQEASDDRAGLYLGFAAATAELGFDELTEQAWELAEREHGGFQESASRYAQRFRESTGLP
ncbi:MAG TPA: DUF4375 domain-containing protein [Terracidiphilus sp.]|nr:DUF4375 domain-containing protein [Terracidiphilus sp.]